MGRDHLGGGYRVSTAIALVGGVGFGPFLNVGSSSRRPGVDADLPMGWSQGWTRTVIALGVTATIVMVCEGGMLAWGSLLLHDHRGATLAPSAAAVTGYTLGQMSGRLFGDHLAARFGARVVFTAGGVVGTFGLATAILAPRPVAALVGFAAAGAGLSVLMPLMFGEIGQTTAAGTSAGVVVARFTTFAYAGILLGPPIIGVAADRIGLVITMATLVPLLAIITTTTRLPDTDVHH